MLSLEHTNVMSLVGVCVAGGCPHAHENYNGNFTETIALESKPFLYPFFDVTSLHIPHFSLIIMTV